MSDDGCDFPHIRLATDGNAFSPYASGNPIFRHRARRTDRILRSLPIEFQDEDET